MEAKLPSLRITYQCCPCYFIEDNKGLLCKIRCWARKAVIFVKEEKEGKGKEEDLCEGVKEEGTHKSLLVDRLI